MLLALSHIHRAGVIHLDVKPSNVFIEGAGAQQHAKLGDFDVSAPNEARATTVAVSRVAGYTLDYAAPEVLACGTVTAAADCFSAGLVLLDAHLALRGNAARPAPLTGPALRTVLTRAESAAQDGTLCDLLEALLQHDASLRPSASVALAHAYLADDALRRAEEKEQLLGGYGTCCLCREFMYEMHGLSCPRGVKDHFVCVPCLTDKVRCDSSLVDDNDLAARKGRVFCVGRTLKDSCCFGGNALPYADADIAKRVPGEAFDAYLKVREELMAAELSRAKDEELRQAVQQELERLRTQSEAERLFHAAHKHICENILTLRYVPTG